MERKGKEQKFWQDNLKKMLKKLSNQKLYMIFIQRESLVKNFLDDVKDTYPYRQTMSTQVKGRTIKHRQFSINKHNINFQVTRES